MNTLPLKLATALPQCRACGSALERIVLDLGSQPLANAYVALGQAHAEPRYPLRVRVCSECFLVQADHDLPADAIFKSDYPYFSSVSQTWVAHARSLAEDLTKRLSLGPDHLVIEVASNDGYLLQHFKSADIRVLGVEPTSSTAAVALERGIPTEIRFFSSDVAKELKSQVGLADLMLGINVLAHTPDIVDFARGFSKLLKPNGIACFEFPHLLALLEGCTFDTIYHEHFSYLSLLAVERIFSRAGLRVFDVEELKTHGGSLRVYACLPAAKLDERPGLARFRLKECAAGLHEMSAYDRFAARVESIRSAFLGFLQKARTEGKTIMAYGAAAKGNTFLNTCGVGSRDITCVADASPAKQGKLLPGSRIPIVAPRCLLESAPDYVVILPWNLADEIVPLLAPLRERGTRFVAAIPSLRVF